MCEIQTRDVKRAYVRKIPSQMHHTGQNGLACSL